MTRRIAALAAVLALATLPAAEASDPASNKCGGTYQGTAEERCIFFSKGIPLLVHGDSSAADARVRVWVTIDNPRYEPFPLVECSDEGPGSASCRTGIPDETTTLDFPHQASTVFFRLVCHVRGAGTGEYGCRAGS